MPESIDPRQLSSLPQRLLFAVLALFAVGGFVRLGLWQLDRANEKQALIDQYENGRQSTVTLTAENADTLPRYQQIRVSGHYDPARQILLENMPAQSGRPGYRVVTPFQLEQGDWLLVDRGWIAPGATRADLPKIAVGGEPRTIVGRIDALPRAGLRMDQGAQENTWPRVLSFPDQPTVERALGTKVRAGLILLDPAEPDGYERVWQARLPIGPERHIAYAVQWFALAAAVVVIYVIVNFRRKKPAQ